MPKKRRTVNIPVAWDPPRPQKSPNPIPEGFSAARKVGGSTMGRSRANTEVEWRPDWKKSVQPVQMVHPIRNAKGGARGLNPTETPDRIEGNK
jgi:hypothetical protein